MPLLLAVATLHAADPSRPHEHQGKVAAYKGAPPPVSLTATDLSTLQSGTHVLKQVQSGNGGRGVAIMDILAAPDRIWSRITSFAMYPKWVDNVAACDVYKKEGNEIFAKFVLDPLGMTVEYYIRHTYRPDLGWLTWTLDYTRNSDLDDSVGYWRVTPLSTTPPRSRLEYSVDIRFKGWVPGFMADMISESGLVNATSWVKRQSEAR